MFDDRYKEDDFNRTTGTTKGVYIQIHFISDFFFLSFKFE